MMSNDASVLIVDDEAEIAEFVADVFEMNGITATYISDPDLLERHLGVHTKLIVLDLLMPKANGIQLLARIAERANSPSVLLMSGETSNVIEQARLRAIDLDITVAGTLNKPFFADDLEALIKTLDLRS